MGARMPFLSNGFLEKVRSGGILKYSQVPNKWGVLINRGVEKYSEM